MKNPFQNRNGFRPGIPPGVPPGGVPLNMGPTIPKGQEERMACSCGYRGDFLLRPVATVEYDRIAPNVIRIFPAQAIVCPKCGKDAIAEHLRLYSAGTVEEPEKLDTAVDVPPLTSDPENPAGDEHELQ